MEQAEDHLPTHTLHPAEVVQVTPEVAFLMEVVVPDPQVILQGAVVQDLLVHREADDDRI